MTEVGYIVIGVLVSLFVSIQSMMLGGILSLSPEVGAISILSGIVVMCTLIVVDAIKNNN